MKEDKSSSPLISVVMNCYNGEKYLNQSIQSLIQQSYKNWELIFWNNNSTDKSEEIFKKFNDKRLKYFCSGNKTSLYKARNLSVQKTNGEYLTFLDVDDFWLVDRLKKQVDFFVKFPNINFVYGNFFIFNERKNKKKIAHKNINLPSGNTYQSLLKYYSVGLVSICLKKKIFTKFDDRFDIIGDFDAIIKIAKKNDFGVIKEPLSVYRLHENNFSFLNKKQHYDELSIWYEENLKNDNEIEKSIKKKFETQLYELHILSLIFSNSKVEALEMILKKCSLLKKMKFILFLIIPNRILKKLIDF